MEIAVIGTGTVGRALAGRLVGLGHEVVMGTRDVAATLARVGPDERGTPAVRHWSASHPGVQLVPLREAGARGELIVNATAGAVSLAALEAVGADALAGKVLVDVAQPLERSAHGPPRLLSSGTDSLGERIQRTFPAAHVVKTLNTVLADVMVDPARLPGRHTMFVAGDDAGAKEVVTGLLSAFGWPRADVIDLGGIVAARTTEMYIPLFFTLARQLGTHEINIAVVQGELPPATSAPGGGSRP